jgi:hypothetical protein
LRMENDQMKRVEQRVVVREERWQVVELRCDMCGAAATEPDAGRWSSAPNTEVIQLCVDEWHDGDMLSCECDLCPECAKWLIEEIKSGRLKMN